MSIRFVLILNTITLVICVAVIIMLGLLLFQAKKKLAAHGIKLFGKKKQK